jgi:pimeloyl-ACP methyl ester carboxylesterase
VNGHGEAAQARHERPVYFTAGDTPLFGVLTAPTGPPTGTGVLLLAGGIYVLSTNRNRMYVRLARRLAALGHTVLRIDFRGVGESAGVIGDYSIADPNPGDAAAAVRCLLAVGVQRVAIVGSCFGARSALEAAADDPALARLVLFSPPVGDEGEGDAPEPHDIGPRFTEQLRTLWRRRIPTLVVYGRGDRYYRDFRAAVAGPLAGFFGATSPFVVHTLPGHAHTLQHVSTQDRLIDESVAWLAAPGSTGVKGAK